MSIHQRRILFVVLVVPLLLPVSVRANRARHPMGAQIRSNFGDFTSGSWLIQGPTSSTINGVSVKTSIICPPSQWQIVPGSANQPICVAQVAGTANEYLFLYEIPAPPENSVYTFSGLTGFSFYSDASDPHDSKSSFGVFQCQDPDSDSTCVACPEQGAPCTKLSTVDLNNLNLSFDSLDGDLIVTVPSFPAEKTSLVLFILEQFPCFPSCGSIADMPNVPPTPSLNIGGAIVSPANPRFGSQEVGTASPSRIVTVYNSPDLASDINITGITTSDSFSSTGDCAASAAIASGNMCAFALSFAPSSVGSASGTFDMSDDSPPGHEIATLTGAGNTAGVSFSPSVLAFGTLVAGDPTSTQTIPITITNSSGPDPFTFSFPTINNSESGSPDFSAVDHCGGSVSVGASCQVDVTFTPSFSGSLTQSWVVADNSVEGSHTLELSGTAIDQSLLDVSASPVSLDFGNQLVGASGGPLTYSFFNNLNNPNGPLTVEVVSTSAEFAVTSDSCTTAQTTAQIGLGKSCSVQVTFNPTVGGQVSGTLTIADDVINGSLVVPLTGTAQDFALSTSSDSVSTAQGGTATYNLSLTPAGGFTGTVQIACAGLPDEATFASCPSSVDISNSSSSSITISVKTTAPIVCSALPSFPTGPPGNAPLLWMSLLCLVSILLAMASSRPRAPRVALASIVVVIGLTCVSCGGGGSTTTITGPQCTPDPGTPTGSSTITVTASSSSLQHALPLTLAVTQ